MSAQPAVKDMTPKKHQINIVHFTAFFLMWHLFQANMLFGTPSAYTLPPHTYTPVCEVVCEQWFRNLPGNPSSDLYLLFYPVLHSSTCCWWMWGGKDWWKQSKSKRGRHIVCRAKQIKQMWWKSQRHSLFYFHFAFKRFSWEGGRQESLIYNCWLSFILQSLD